MGCTYSKAAREKDLLQAIVLLCHSYSRIWCLDPGRCFYASEMCLLSLPKKEAEASVLHLCKLSKTQETDCFVFVYGKSLEKLFLLLIF